ncbi:MAG: YmdB family metallophosphoesterase [Parvularculaceae bacterium]
MRIAFYGDIVGRSGRAAVALWGPKLRARLDLDFVLANGENAAGGFGVTERVCGEIFDAGVDVITTGNHAYDQRESLLYFDREERLLRPANYPNSTPGRGSGVYADANGRRVLVVNVIGQRFMNPVDDPFEAAGRAVEAMPLARECDAVVVDIHAEASSEKMGMGHFLDGHASLVVGSHTHIPTADVQVLPSGTAYMTDAGMCGDYDSVVGMGKEESLRRFVTKMASERMTPATGPATLCGVYVETDDATGLAKTIEPIRLGGRLAQTPVIAGVEIR